MNEITINDTNYAVETIPAEMLPKVVDALGEQYGERFPEVFAADIFSFVDFDTQDRNRIASIISKVGPVSVNI